MAFVVDSFHNQLQQSKTVNNNNPKLSTTTTTAISLAAKTASENCQ
jgi:hypothetical protein